MIRIIFEEQTIALVESYFIPDTNREIMNISGCYTKNEAAKEYVLFGIWDLEVDGLRLYDCEVCKHRNVFLAKNILIITDFWASYYSEKLTEDEKIIRDIII
jgi:hypothetical protein